MSEKSVDETVNNLVFYLRETGRAISTSWIPDFILMNFDFNFVNSRFKYAEFQL
jgi:hypothetical protein